MLREGINRKYMNLLFNFSVKLKLPQKSFLKKKKHLYGNANFLYPDCIDINIQIVILYSIFTRCVHWSKVDKGYTHSVSITS